MHNSQENMKESEISMKLVKKGVNIAMLSFICGFFFPDFPYKTFREFSVFKML